MLDIDFLNKEKSQLRKIVSYVFSDGYFRSDVIRKIKLLAESRGDQIEVLKDTSVFNTFIASGSLFGEILFIIDLEVFLKNNKIKDLDILISFSEEVDNKNRYLLLADSRISKVEKAIESDEFKSIINLGSKITELKPSKKNLVRCYDFFIEDSELIDVDNRDLFLMSLEQWFLNIRPDLGAFFNKLEFFYFTCVENHIFNSQEFQKMNSNSSGSAFFEMHRLISDLIISQNEESSKRFFQAVVKMRTEQNLADRQILFKFFSSFKELILMNRHLNGNEESMIKHFSAFKLKQLEPCRQIPMVRLLRFQLILAKRSVQLNTGNFLIEIKRLFEDFIKNDNSKKRVSSAEV